MLKKMTTFGNVCPDCLESCPVETLEMTLQNNGTVGELVQVKHFLEKLSRLEWLVVHFPRGISTREKLQVTTDLIMLPRACLCA